jgi:hypothetical protein
MSNRYKCDQKKEGASIDNAHIQMHHRSRSCMIRQALETLERDSQMTHQVLTICDVLRMLDEVNTVRAVGDTELQTM